MVVAAHHMTSCDKSCGILCSPGIAHKESLFYIEFYFILFNNRDRRLVGFVSHCPSTRYLSNHNRNPRI